MAITYNQNYAGTGPFSDVTYQVNCSTGAPQIITVAGLETTTYQALFSYASNSNVFVSINNVPVLPASGTVGAQPYNEFKPIKRYVRGGDVIHLITPDDSAYIGVSLMKLQQ